MKACDACQKMLPSQQKEPLISDPLPSRPFEDVSADLFTHAGKDYLIYADRLSGWPCVAEYGREASSHTTTKLLCRIFRGVGVPVRLRSDGGSQFTSSKFQSFTQRLGINHVLSSPGYPQSNGHAEAFVKKVKYLIAKVCTTGASDEEAFDRGSGTLHALMVAPQLRYCTVTRSGLPCPHTGVPLHLSGRLLLMNVTPARL